jgi:hypothetical protein
MTGHRACSSCRRARSSGRPGYRRRSGPSARAFRPAQ